MENKFFCTYVHIGVTTASLAVVFVAALANAVAGGEGCFDDSV